MENGKLEFKIVEDGRGNHINMDDLSLVSAKSLSLFLKSIIEIVEAMPDSDGIRFKIVRGSVGVVAEGPEAKIVSVQTDFNKIIERESEKKETVATWKNVQSLILNTGVNGLKYEVNFYSKGEKVEVVEKLKREKAFRVKVKKKKSDTNLVFFKTTLLQNGGRTPNLRIFHDGEEKVIHCDKSTVERIKNFVYQDVMISAWRKITEGGKPHYTFCDIYKDEEDYNEIRSFIEKNYDLSESEEFISIHDKAKEYFEKEELGMFRKIMRLYNSPATSVGNLKAVLVVTKAFKDNPKIKDLRDSIKEILEKKIGQSIV